MFVVVVVVDAVVVVVVGGQSQDGTTKTHTNRDRGGPESSTIRCWHFDEDPDAAATLHRLGSEGGTVMARTNRPSGSAIFRVNDQPQR